MRCDGMSSCSSTHSSEGINSSRTNLRVWSTIDWSVSLSAMVASPRCSRAFRNGDVMFMQGGEVALHLRRGFGNVPIVEMSEEAASRRDHVNACDRTDFCDEVAQQAHQRFHHHYKDRITRQLGQPDMKFDVQLAFCFQIARKGLALCVVDVLIKCLQISFVGGLAGKHDYGCFDC